jgi:hypothetical protein
MAWTRAVSRREIEVLALAEARLSDADIVGRLRPSKAGERALSRPRRSPQPCAGGRAGLFSHEPCVHRRGRSRTESGLLFFAGKLSDRWSAQDIAAQLLTLLEGIFVLGRVAENPDRLIAAVDLTLDCLRPPALRDSA